MTLQELFNIRNEELPFNVTRAVDVPNLKTMELSELQYSVEVTNLLYNLCNQLVWNYLLQTEALTPYKWGPTTLKTNVLAVPVGKFEMKYKYHSLPATPVNVLSLPYSFIEYENAVRDITKMCLPIATSAIALIGLGVDKDTAMWVTHQLHKMEELLWYKTTT